MANFDSTSQCDAYELCELVGYSVFTCTHVAGEFEGADFGARVTLDNGMVFEFQEFHYTYAYRPHAVVLTNNVTYEGRRYQLYRLVIGDHLYNAIRVR